MGPVDIPGDLVVKGNLFARTFTPPSGCMEDGSVEAAANIAETKLQHRFHAVQNSSHGTAVAAKRTAVHIVRNATGEVKQVSASLPVACIGDSTISIAVKKNGTNILSSPIAYSSADAAFAVKNGTISTPDLVVGDVLEVDVTVTAGTGTLGQGLIVQLNVIEDSP